MNQSKSTTVRFYALDAGRGLSALAIALFHFSALQGHLLYLESLDHAFICVDFFFVLSGFVITHAYSNRVTDKRSLMRYVIQRFGRVWPLHIIVLAFFVLYEISRLIHFMKAGGGTYQPFSGGSSLSALLSNIFMTHSLGIHDSLTWNKPSWSISAEFFVYMVFGVLLVTVKRFLKPISLAIILLSLYVIANDSDVYMDTTYQYGFLRCLAGFLAGHLVYAVYQHRSIDSLFSKAGLTMAQLICGILTLTYIYFSGETLTSIFAPLVFSVVVYVFATQNGLPAKLLSTKFFRYLGDRSYSIYMVHYFIFIIMYTVLALVENKTGQTLIIKNGEGNIWFMDAMTLLYIATILIVSEISYRFIEMPGQAYFKRLSKKI